MTRVRTALVLLGLVTVAAGEPAPARPTPRPPTPRSAVAGAPQAAASAVASASPSPVPSPPVEAPPAPVVPAEPPPGTVVHEVSVEGNERLDRETVLYYTTLRPGSVFEPEVARSDFRKLWETGFFEDLSLETRPSAQQVDLVWHLSERPMLSRVEFSGNEGVVEEDIKKALKERGIEFRESTPFGMGQVERARAVMEELFRAKGYRFVKVTPSVSEDPDGGRIVAFKVDEGAKVRISTIEFEGNRAFSSGDLRGAFKRTKEEGFFCFISKKCVFNEPTFNEDLEHLRDYYYDRGYINFAMGEPVIDSVGEGKKRRLEVRIPVIEGQQYRVAKVDVTGNQAYSKEALLRLNKVEPGRPFSRKKMNESREAMSTVYGVKGYFNVLIVPDIDPDKDKPAVDLTYTITENELYYVHRIAFKGNTTTKDKVIRRQLKIAEGDLFNTAKFKRSLFRVYQLGYFKEPQPKIDPSKEDPAKLDITVDLQEEGRNDIRVGGGYSGVEGFFGTLSFSTRNLFGSGNSLTVDLQGGKRVKQYLLSYIDPYLFDRPVSGGVDVFNRFAQYTDFERRGTGGQVQLGYQFADFWYVRNSYRYEKVDQQPRELFDADGTPIPIDPELATRLTDRRRVSAMEPVLSFSNIDNPIRPWKGFRQIASVEYSGGVLGGTTNLIKPRINSTAYIPLGGRVNFAINAEASWVKGFGGRTVPLFERFFLGGEQSLRGFPVYHVSPVGEDSAGNDVLLGGDKMILFNNELQFKIASPLSLVLFADAGNAFDNGESLSFGGLKTSFGGEVRFWTPFLQAPLRLIYSYVPDPLVRNGRRDPKTDFTFSIGTTF